MGREQAGVVEGFRYEYLPVYVLAQAFIQILQLIVLVNLDLLIRALAVALALDLVHARVGVSIQEALQLVRGYAGHEGVPELLPFQVQFNLLLLLAFPMARVEEVLVYKFCLGRLNI